MLLAIAESSHGQRPERTVIENLVSRTPGRKASARPERRACWASSRRCDRHLSEDTELAAIMHALDGGYIRPAPGGDLLRTPEVLPTGRNLHGFDPFRIPSAFAVRDGARQAERLLAAPHGRRTDALPETVAMVLWGTDNLKTEGGPIAPGAVADRRRAALRQLRPPRRRDAGPARRARPPAHRCGDHAVRHLPRPAAVADQAAGRGGVARRHGRRAARTATSSASTRWPTRPSMAAIWRPRRCGCSAMPRAPTAPTSIT